VTKWCGSHINYQVIIKTHIEKMQMPMGWKFGQTETECEMGVVVME
jgi:hypothetical protein